MNGYSSKQRFISLTLKTAVILSAVIGIVLSAAAGRASFMGGSVVFMYFTIQSNIAIALICATGFLMLLMKRDIPDVWHIIKFVGTVSITLTGVVFCFVLTPTLGVNAWNIQNTLTHVVVPLLSVADFFVTAVSGDIKKRNVMWVTVPPILYAIYAGIGYVSGWQFSSGKNYPYFFLNWGSSTGVFGFSDELPFMGTAWWILAILVFLIVVGLVYLGIIDLLKKKLGK